jgi:hypothetical protein
MGFVTASMWFNGTFAITIYADDLAALPKFHGDVVKFRFNV